MYEVQTISTTNNDRTASLLVIFQGQASPVLPWTLVRRFEPTEACQTFLPTGKEQPRPQQRSDDRFDLAPAGALALL